MMTFKFICRFEKTKQLNTINIQLQMKKQKIDIL